MPEVARIGNIIIRVFADDTKKHRAPHFHAVDPDGQMVVGLPGLNIIVGSVHRPQEVVNWARRPANMRRLVDEWNRGNPTMKVSL